MNQKKTWTVVTSIILTVLFEILCVVGLISGIGNEDPNMIIGGIIYIIYGLIYWLPTFIHPTPKVFLINFANILCCFAWIGALVVAIMDKKNPNGTSTSTWNQNPTWDNTNSNAQNYWDNNSGNQWDNPNVNAQGQQPVQPNTWETPNQSNQPYMNNEQNGQTGQTNWENNNGNNNNVGW